MIDYTISFREQYAGAATFPATERYDFFCAAYTEDDRSRVLYDAISSTTKIWLLLPEYGFADDITAEQAYTAADATTEAEYFSEFSNRYQITAQTRLAIDISGMLAPYLLFLLRKLAVMGVTTIDVFYSEPARYIHREETRFSGENLVQVRQVYGFQGAHSTDTNADLIIIGSGYDHQLLKAVAEAKEGCRAIQMFGLPALRPDMYQQNILRAMRASESMGRGAGEHPSNYLVPAHDPFRVATFLSQLRESEKFTNLYLCPLATKPQVLGFGLFYLNECLNEPISLLYPMCRTFPKKTSDGVGRIWNYRVEFDLAHA
jgi:hypothetical protein